MVWHLQWKMVYQTNGYKWDFPINHGRPPSDVRGCRFTCAGGVSSREQFVSGALSVIPSTTRVLYLYDVVLDLPEKWVFQTSSSFQTRILCGWSFFFFDDCWILTGQLWDVGWLWWLNWKSHTMPTIPWDFSKSTITFASFVTLCFKNQLQLSLTRQIFSTNRAACGFFMFFQWPGQLHFSVHDCSDGLHFGSVRRS